MDEITQRAHEFAIEAVRCFYHKEITRATNNGSSPKYDLNALTKTYITAFDAMEAELHERCYQNSQANK